MDASIGTQETERARQTRLGSRDKIQRKIDTPDRGGAYEYNKDETKERNDQTGRRTHRERERETKTGIERKTQTETETTKIVHSHIQYVATISAVYPSPR